MLITRRQWITGANGEGLPEGEVSLRISQKSSLWNKLYMSSELHIWWKLQVRIYAINFYSVSLCASHSAGNGERESQWIGNEGLSLPPIHSESWILFFVFWLGLCFLIYYYYYYFYFTILYWFCLTSTCIHHGCTHVPHPEPPSDIPPRTIPLGHPSAPAPSILYPASNLDWRFVSYILYMFQCHSPKSSHPLPLPQSPKDCSIPLCFFCCLAYRVIVTIFLNSIYMR